jgi:hypothetical protein
MQEIPESVQATINAIHQELKTKPEGARLQRLRKNSRF